ncbi:MAG TPA: hypothetical protein DD438_00535 [Verrucomicrobiales bacterium]|nr:hypothetical protein [Verrucomicrobiales bacterium]
MKFAGAILFLILYSPFFAGGAQLSEAEVKLASNHPRTTYQEVRDITAMAEALRRELSLRNSYSFSRGWWVWDRLRARYIDGGRRDRNELLILQAVFRALILDWHAKLEKQGEEELMFIFFVTTAPGSKVERKLPDGAVLKRDYHGGGYHGGWGGGARMRIYEELVRQKMLTTEEQARFKEIVYQSMSRRFLDFTKGSQSADNHSFGNAGGIAMALKLFPGAPQAQEARSWIARIWSHLTDFGDWTEWNYFPYGPIFLHGMIDIAESMDWIETEAEQIHAVGKRVLGFIHGGGLRGGPNCGSPVFSDRNALYRDPWNLGNYRVESPGRDGHFWYRLAQHYRNSNYLWAATQSVFGGDSPESPKIEPFKEAYAERFGWFQQRGIRPEVPQDTSRIGLLSSLKGKIPERLYLGANRKAGTPFASYFLYPKKDQHLDSLSGHLYEYVANGAKFLHSSGKYSMLGKGGGTGEESLDVLLVMQGKNSFPLHPDRAEGGDFIRKGAIQIIHSALKVGSNAHGDSYGQVGWENYYGKGSKWIRRTVLTREGFLIVSDTYTPSSQIGADFLGGPIWHLAREDGQKDGPRKESWFDAPAFEHAWWQKSPQRIRLTLHPSKDLKFGQIRQNASQDLDPNITSYAYRPVTPGNPNHFLSVFTPYPAGTLPPEIDTAISDQGACSALFTDMRVHINPGGEWRVTRTKRQN